MKALILFAALILTSSFLAPPKEVKIQYTFKKGDTYEWAQTTSQKVNQSIAGTEQNIETALNVTMIFKVSELTATGARFEVEYTKIYTKIKAPQFEVVMDGEGDTSVMYNKIMIAMKGKKFNFNMTKSGVIESVDNVENLWSGLNTKIGMTEAQVAQMKPSLEQSFGKNTFKSSIGLMMPNYPETKVKVGTKWTNKTSMGSTFPMQVENTYTVNTLTDASADIGSDGKITTTDSTKTIDLSGFKATTNLSGKQATKNTINLATGWPTESKSYSEITGKMIMLAGGPIPEDMTVPMEIKTESTCKVTKK